MVERDVDDAVPGRSYPSNQLARAIQASRLLQQGVPAVEVANTLGFVVARFPTGLVYAFRGELEFEFADTAALARWVTEGCPLGVS